MAMWRITVSASGMYLGEKLSNFMNRGRLTEEAASIHAQTAVYLTKTRFLVSDIREQISRITL